MQVAPCQKLAAPSGESGAERASTQATVSCEQTYCLLHCTAWYLFSKNCILGKLSSAPEEPAVQNRRHL